jgi:diguanylate cyclase (GGDEF)-like protein
MFTRMQTGRPLHARTTAPPTPDLVRQADEVGRFDSSYVAALVLNRWAIVVVYITLGATGVLPVHPLALAFSAGWIVLTNIAATWAWLQRKRMPWYDNAYLFLDGLSVTFGVLATANLDYPIWLAYALVISTCAAEQTTRYSVACTAACVAAYVLCAVTISAAGWDDPMPGVVAVAASILAFLGVSLTVTFDGNRRLRSYIRKMSVTDALTGLTNRRRLSDVLANPGPTAGGLAVVVLDVDNFKPYNDTFGHLAGDQLLVRLSGSLQAHFPDAHTISRYGGDEFVVLLPCHSTAAAEGRAACLISPECPDSVPISIGIAMWPHDEATLDGALAAADDCLREAKRSGKGRLTTVARTFREHRRQGEARNRTD